MNKQAHITKTTGSKDKSRKPAIKPNRITDKGFEQKAAGV
jgi:hypothetical protein